MLGSHMVLATDKSVNLKKEVDYKWSNGVVLCYSDQLFDCSRHYLSSIKPYCEIHCIIPPK